MANGHENLRTLTSEEAREIGRKGGIASGKARAERKKFREDLIKALGAIKDGKTVQEIGIEAIIEKFISGDMQAFTIVRDTIGEKPTDKIEADVGITNINVKLDDDE
jgi:general stress protein YciG